MKIKKTIRTVINKNEKESRQEIEIQNNEIENIIDDEQATKDNELARKEAIQATKDNELAKKEAIQAKKDNELAKKEAIQARKDAIRSNLNKQ